jgi:hypothetical protein
VYKKIREAKMIDQIQDVISQITGNNENEIIEEPTIDSTENELNLESMVSAPGINNATERHVNEHEINYQTQITQSVLVLDFSLTVTVNSLYSLFLLSAITGVSESFSPIPFHILSAAFNTALGTALLSGKKIEKKYVFGLMVSRIGLTSSVNGVVLSKISEKVDTSRVTQNQIQEEIKNFEGYTPPPEQSLYDIVGGVLIALAALGVFARIGLSFLLKGNSE